MYLNIIETKNNVFVNLAKPNKKVVFKASGGMVPFKTRKRKFPLVAELLGKLIMEKLIFFKVRRVGICVHGPFNNVVRSFFRGLSATKKTKLKYIFVEEKKGMAHNGVRLKKKRRL